MTSSIDIIAEIMEVKSLRDRWFEDNPQHTFRAEVNADFEEQLDRLFKRLEDH